MTAFCSSTLAPCGSSAGCNCFWEEESGFQGCRESGMRSTCGLMSLNTVINLPLMTAMVLQQQTGPEGNGATPCSILEGFWYWPCANNTSSASPSAAVLSYQPQKGRSETFPLPFSLAFPLPWKACTLLVLLQHTQTLDPGSSQEILAGWCHPGAAP